MVCFARVSVGNSRHYHYRESDLEIHQRCSCRVAHIGTSAVEELTLRSAHVHVCMEQPALEYTEARLDV